MQTRLLLILLPFLFIFSNNAFGQEKIKKKGADRAESVQRIDESDPQKFWKEVTFDIRLHTNGFAFGGNYGLIKSDRKTVLFQLELTTIKHPREVRQSFDVFQGPAITSPKAFIYGKRNHFYGLHFGYGIKKYFSQKTKKRGVAVGMTYVFGPSLGITKPYFLDLIRFSDDMADFEIVSESYSEENADLFLNPGTIYGASGFAHGFDQLNFIPGAHGKVAVHFDWGAMDQFVKAIDAGIMVDIYHKDIPIMLTEDNRFLFINLYLSLQLGKRS
ncbi:MAG: hypothetical protein AAF502_05835 [Bacteroidota bacterium]